MSWRRALPAVARLGSWTAGWLAFAWSRLERGSQVLSCASGGGALGPRVAVFCHFDPRGRIRPHTRAYLDALCDEGLALVFVSNAGRLGEAELAWLRPRAARILLRRNLGYDFAAWRDALAACGLPAAETELLLIANDSVYGPLTPLRPVLARMDFAEADVWSATDSWQHRFHLQSFFVAFGPRALRHEAFARFWREVGNIRSKRWIVMHYELGLSRAFIQAGLRCRALWPYTLGVDALRQLARQAPGLAEGAAEEVVAEPLAGAAWDNARRILGAARHRRPLNPTADLWRVLILLGCPFLKRELLQRNPSAVPDVAGWSELVAGISASAHDLILRDLELSLRNESP